MANDLVVRLNGDSKGFQDSINSAKDSLKGLQQEGTKLDQFQSRFDKVVNSSKPMKKQLADLRGMLAEMNREGLNTSDVFTQIAQHAGSLADNIGDAQAAVKAFANDNFNLQASAEAFQVVAAGGALVTGAMAMMGVESERTTEIIAKVQGAIALLNGVQSISNLLNKDSALMLKLKQIQMKINEAQTKKNTVAQTANNVAEATGKAQTLGATAATTANTVSTVANTTATTANTVAQNAWNTAKAIGKALLGDWSGLLLIGAGALATYAIATSNSTDKTEQNTDAVGKQSKIMQEQQRMMQNYSDSVGTNVGKMVASFKKLQSQWNEMESLSSKTQWIKNNQEEFNKLGMSIKNVNDAENIFVRNSEKMLKAFELRAQAAAAESMLTDAYETYFKGKFKYQNYFKAGDNPYGKLTDGKTGEDLYEKWWKWQQQKDGTNDRYFDYVMNNKLTQRGATSFNQYLKENGINDAGAKEMLDNVILFYEETTKNSLAQLKALGIESYSKSGKQPTTTTSTTNKENPPVEGSLEYWKQIRSEQEKIMNYNPVGSDSFNGAIEKWIEANNQVKDLEEQMKALKGEAEKTKEVIVGSLEDIDKKLKDANEKLKEFTIDTPQEAIDSQKELIKNLQKQRKDLAERLKIEEDKIAKYTIEVEAEPEAITKGSIWDKRASYQNAQSTISQLQQDVELKIMGADEAMTIIDQLNEKLMELGLKPIVIKVENGQLVTAEQATENIIGYANSAANAFQSLGSAMQSLDQGGELAKAGLIASAIGQLVATFAASFKGTWSIWEWIAGAVSGIATLTSVISQISRFENGGIVGGSSYSGDRMLARVNSGEMILNKNQQANLFNSISSGNLGSNLGGKVTFEIEGTKLRGVLNNFDRKMSKIR